MDLCTASGLGILEFVKTTIKKNQTEVLKANQKSWTPIMYACIYCQEQIVNLFVNLVPSCVYSINAKMQTPLMLSTISGNFNIVKMLLKKEILECKDIKGWTALFYAVAYGHVDVICYLIKCGANINARDYSSQTVLFIAVQEEKENIVELLLTFGANCELTNIHGIRAIDIALQDKQFKLVNLLSIPTITDMNSLLNSLCLDRYSRIMRRNNIELNQFLKFNEDDLKQIGIELLGPRRKMILAISRLNYMNDLKIRLQNDMLKF